jgi:hypothetical protein
MMFGFASRGLANPEQKKVKAKIVSPYANRANVREHEKLGNAPIVTSQMPVWVYL